MQVSLLWLRHPRLHWQTVFDVDLDRWTRRSSFLLSSLEKKKGWVWILADKFVMCAVYMMCESSRCRLFVAWGKTRKRKEAVHQLPYSLVSLQHAHQSMQSLLPTTSQYISVLLTLLLDIECESSFKGRGRRSSFPLSKPVTKKHNNLKTCWVYQCVPGNWSLSCSWSSACGLLLHSEFLPTIFVSQRGTWTGRVLWMNELMQSNHEAEGLFVKTCIKTGRSLSQGKWIISFGF